MKRILRDALIVFIVLAVLLSLAPFAIPVSSYSFEDKKPFPESKFVDINGIKIHYREWNPENQNPEGKAVFIHGFYGSTYSWNKSISELAKRGFYVVAVDLPGFGYSSKQTGVDHSLSARANLVWDLLTKLDLANDKFLDLPWNLVGHSMGAAVAAKIAEQRDNIGVLILVDPVINNAQNSWLKLVSWSPSVKRWISVSANYYLFEYNRIKDTLESAYGRRPSDEEVRGYLDPLKENGTALAAGDIATANTDEKVDLSKVAVATLVIYGEKDTWVKKSDVEKIKSDLRFSMLEVIPGAGHIPQETNTNEFNKLLLNFMDLSYENTAQK